MQAGQCQSQTLDTLAGAVPVCTSAIRTATVRAPQPAW